MTATLSQQSLVYKKNVLEADPKIASHCTGLTPSRKLPRTETVSKVFQSKKIHSFFRGNASAFFNHLFHLFVKRRNRPLDFTLETAKETGTRKLSIATDFIWRKKKVKMNFDSRTFKKAGFLKTTRHVLRVKFSKQKPMQSFFQLAFSDVQPSS